MEMTLVRTNELKAFYLDGSEEAAQEAAKHLTNHGIGCGRVRVSFSTWCDGWGVQYGEQCRFITPGSLVWLTGGIIDSVQLRDSGGVSTGTFLPTGYSLKGRNIPPRYFHSKHQKKKVEFEIDASGAKFLQNSLEMNWPYIINEEGHPYNILYDALKEIEA